MTNGPDTPAPFVVVSIQPTPNPNAVKFMLDRSIAEAPLSFLTAAATAGHPLATRLFAIPGVTGLLFLNDFITVNKSPETVWPALKKSVKRVLGQK